MEHEDEEEFQDCLDEVQFAKQFKNSDEDPAAVHEHVDSEGSESPSQDLVGNEENKIDPA